MAAGFRTKKSDRSPSALTLTSGLIEIARAQMTMPAIASLPMRPAVPLGSRPSGNRRLNQKIPRNARLQPQPLPHTATAVTKSVGTRTPLGGIATCTVPSSSPHPMSNSSQPIGLAGRRMTRYPPIPPYVRRNTDAPA